MNAGPGKPRRRRFFDPRYVRVERRRGPRRALTFVLLAIPVCFAFQQFVVGTGVVTDISMLPTLREGRYFVINKVVYRFRPPRRGEIVVFRETPESRDYTVKRVAAAGGDMLEIRAGRVRVNGRLLEEPYAKGQTQPEMGPIRVPEGTCFVLGDNRDHSEDSRRFGPVHLERIVGKIYP